MLNSLFQYAVKPYWRTAAVAAFAVTLSACVSEPQSSSSAQTTQSSSVVVVSSEAQVSSSVPLSSSSVALSSSSVVVISSSVVASSSVISSSSVASSSSVVPSSSSVTSSSSVAACNATTSAQYLKGENLYKGNCSFCHGPVTTNGKTAGAAVQAIDVAKAPYGKTNQATLAAYISTGMKAYLPASCSGSEAQCAADIAHYLQVATKVVDPCAQSSAATASSVATTSGGILYEDNFESHTSNAKPVAPWVSYHDGDPAQIANYVRISTAQSQSGSKSLNIKTESTGSFAYLDFNPRDVNADKLYLRAFWRASNGLGGSVNGHSDMIKLGNFIVNGNFNNNAGTTAIKYGEAKGTVGINLLEHGDAIYPKGPSNGDEKLPKNTWVCLEILFDKKPANAYADTLTTWVDGRMVSEIKAANQADWGAAWQNGPPPANWLENIFAGAISFGWQTYGGAGNDIYFDDLVIATERVGCSYMPSGSGAR